MERRKSNRERERRRRVLKSRFTIARWATIATGNRVLQKRFNESRRRHRLSVATTRHLYESIMPLAEIRLSFFAGDKNRKSSGCFFPRRSLHRKYKFKFQYCGYSSLSLLALLYYYIILYRFIVISYIL